MNGCLSLTFDLSLFPHRFHKNSDATVVDDPAPIATEDPLTHCGTEHANSLNTRAKYNLILPIAMNIATLASCHGTEKFMKYMEAMKKVEVAIKD